MAVGCGKVCKVITEKGAGSSCRSPAPPISVQEIGYYIKVPGQWRAGRFTATGSPLPYILGIFINGWGC